MLVNSMAWKVVGFAFPPSARPVAAVVAVLLSEECLRPVVSRQCARLIGELERRATKLGHPSLTLIEKLPDRFAHLPSLPVGNRNLALILHDPNL